MYRQTQMLSVLTSHNVTEKNPINIRFPFCVNLRFASENFKLGSPTKLLQNPRDDWPTVIFKTLFNMYNKALFA